MVYLTEGADNHFQVERRDFVGGRSRRALIFRSHWPRIWEEKRRLRVEETRMVITLDRELETALNELARRQGIGPEVVALNALRERFLRPAPIQPRDDWERELLATASDCGVSLSNVAVSSEGLYE